MSHKMKIFFTTFFNEQNVHQVLNIFWSCYFADSESKKNYCYDIFLEETIEEVIRDWSYLPHNWNMYVYLIQNKQIPKFDDVLDQRRKNLSQLVGKTKAALYNPPRPNLIAILDILDNVPTYYVDEKELLEMMSARILKLYLGSTWVQKPNLDIKNYNTWW